MSSHYDTAYDGDISNHPVLWDEVNPEDIDPNIPYMPPPHHKLETDMETSQSYQTAVTTFSNSDRLIEFSDDEMKPSQEPSPSKSIISVKAPESQKEESPKLGPELEVQLKKRYEDTKNFWKSKGVEEKEEERFEYSPGRGVSFKTPTKYMKRPAVLSKTSKSKAAVHQIFESNSPEKLSVPVFMPLGGEGSENHRKEKLWGGYGPEPVSTKYTRDMHTRGRRTCKKKPKASIIPVTNMLPWGPKSSTKSSDDDELYAQRLQQIQEEMGATTVTECSPELEDGDLLLEW